MPKLLFKVFPVLIFGAIFAYALFNVEYPESFATATIFQLAFFLIPLYLLLTFTLNIFFNFLPLAGILSLSLTTFLILKALDSLNWVTGGLTVISFGLLISYFGQIKWKSSGSHLTKGSKIPTLTSLKRRRNRNNE